MYYNNVKGGKRDANKNRESGRRASASNKNYFYFFTFFFFFLLLLPPINKHIFRLGALLLAFPPPLSLEWCGLVRGGERNRFEWVRAANSTSSSRREPSSSSRSLWSMRKRKKGSRQIISGARTHPCMLYIEKYDNFLFVCVCVDSREAIDLPLYAENSPKMFRYYFIFFVCVWL